jgi:hypothetical protein
LNEEDYMLQKIRKVLFHFFCWLANKLGPRTQSDNNHSKQEIEDHLIEISVVNTARGHAEVVEPGSVVAKKNDTITFKAHESDTKIWFPKMEEIFGETNPFAVLSNKSVEKTIIKVVTKRETFPYAVYCSLSNDFAEGNSAPRIIIDPPNKK